MINDLVAIRRNPTGAIIHPWKRYTICNRHKPSRNLTISSNLTCPEQLSNSQQGLNTSKMSFILPTTHDPFQMTIRYRYGIKAAWLHPILFPVDGKPVATVPQDIWDDINLLTLLWCSPAASLADKIMKNWHRYVISCLKSHESIRLWSQNLRCKTNGH